VAKSDLVGQTFGFLQVLRDAGRHPKRGEVLWECLCTCGALHYARTGHLKRNKVRSCGCKHGELIGEAIRTHGETANGRRSSEYSIWQGIMQRCYDSNFLNYPRYGGRGIRVCAQWHDFTNFLKDMGRRPSLSHSIDRKNGNGDYEPDNCRWATPIEQARNIKTNRLVTALGKTQCLAAWAEETGVKAATIWQRLKLGWHPDRAVSEVPAFKANWHGNKA